MPSCCRKEVLRFYFFLGEFSLSILSTQSLELVLEICGIIVLGFLLIVELQSLASY